jgi:hypothetical protein
MKAVVGKVTIENGGWRVERGGGVGVGVGGSRTVTY